MQPGSLDAPSKASASGSPPPTALALAGEKGAALLRRPGAPTLLPWTASQGPEPSGKLRPAAGAPPQKSPQPARTRTLAAQVPAGPGQAGVSGLAGACRWERRHRQPTHAVDSGGGAALT